MNELLLNIFNLLQQLNARLFNVNENQEKIPNENATHLKALQHGHFRVIRGEPHADVNSRVVYEVSPFSLPHDSSG